jgi:outer membrane protein OmpA-like peptidoglycan-associated protein
MSSYYDELDDRGRWTRRGFGAVALLAIAAFVGNSTLRTDPPTPTISVNTPVTEPESEPDTAATTVPPSTLAEPAPTAATDAPEPTTTPAPAPAATTTADRLNRSAPDGTPLPVLVVYSPTTVTLSGAVPSDDARERLVALAMANSQRPVNVIDDLVIDDLVPDGVGIRVIELDSPRFPDGSADLTPEHSAQFDRVAAVLAALPHVTVLVVGHADQRGDARTNWELSDERARTVVAYLTGAGIEPARLSSRAAGETDLLSIDDDATALALNRRTEFIFSGVLLP